MIEKGKPVSSRLKKAVERAVPKIKPTFLERFSVPETTDIFDLGAAFITEVELEFVNMVSEAAVIPIIINILTMVSLDPK